MVHVMSLYLLNHIIKTCLKKQREKVKTNTAEYFSQRRKRCTDTDTFQSVGRHGSGKDQASLLLNKKQKTFEPPEPYSAEDCCTDEAGIRSDCQDDNLFGGKEYSQYFNDESELHSEQFYSDDSESSSSSDNERIFP